MSRHARATLLPIAVAGLVFAGCGEPSAVSVTNRTVTIVETEYRLAPQNITVKQGPLTIVAINHGRLIHNLAIESIPGDPDIQPTTYKTTETLHPGETSTPITLHLKPGKYRLTCTISNHDDLGQYGALYVTK